MCREGQKEKRLRRYEEQGEEKGGRIVEWRVRTYEEAGEWEGRGGERQ